MLSTYLVCTTCESLISPEKNVCPVCGRAVESGAKPCVFRVLPYVVCSSCGSLMSPNAHLCAVCETPMNHSAKHRIVEQPVELGIVGVKGAATGAT